VATWTRTNDDSPIAAVAFTPDNQYLAWCKTAHGAQLIDLVTRQLAGDYRGHDSGVRRLAFTPDCRQLFTGGGDGKVRAWDLVAPDEPNEDRIYAGATLYQFAFSPDGKYLALPGGRSQSHGQDAREQTLIKRSVKGTGPALVFKGHGGWLTCVAYRPDGKQIATGAEDQTVRLWDANNPAVHKTLKDHEGAVMGVAYTPDGKFLLSGCMDSRIRVWDADSGTLQHTLRGHTGAVTAVACSPAGRYAASASTDQTVRLWDLERHDLVYEIRCPTAAGAAGAAFSRDGTLLACAFADWTIRIYEVATGRELSTRDKPMRLATRFNSDEDQAPRAREWGRPVVISLDFSSDGQRLVSVAPNCDVQLSDVQSGQVALTLRHASLGFHCAAFSPDGNVLAASYGQWMIVWDSTPRPTAPQPYPADELRDWYEGFSGKAERDQNWFAMAFHSRQLRELAPANAVYWYRLAIAHLAQGDAAGHHRICSEMLQHFEATKNVAMAHYVGYACVIDPDAGGHPKTLVALAAQAVKARKGNERLLGAALYRSGDSPAALKQFGNAGPKFGRAWDWLFLAMIHHRLGDAANARECYDTAVRQLGSERPKDWKERIEVECLKREAEQLLQIKGQK
jgi:WD40 repeat protein